jgi:hypothetical protein
MATYINPNAIKDHSVTSIKLADGLIVTDASIAALGYIKDVSNLATKNAAIGSLSLALDSTNYKITLSGTKVDGSTFTVQNVIDLPLESVVVDGSYNNTTKKVVLTLQNGSTVDFSVADLVAGLQSEITSSNKLSADLIQDGTTNKTVTATEKQTWNSAVQPADLAAVATTGAYSDLIDAPTPGPVYYALASAADLTFTKWNASVSGITSYYNGLTFIVVNGSGATVELEGSSATFNVNGLGAKTISRSYLTGGGYTAQNLPANGAILLTYYNNMFYLQAMLYNLADFYSDSTHRLVSDASTAAWNGKQDAISDLATIRENASAGAAKVSNVQSDWDATTGLAVILNKPSNATYSTKGLVSVREHYGLNVNNGQLSANTNGMISTGIDIDSIAYLLATSIDSYDNGNYGLKAIYNHNLTCLTLTPAAANQIGGVKIGSGINVTSDGTISAFSGNYNDLSNKPDAVTESTVSGWGFTKSAAPGTLNTTATTAQSTSASEALSGSITLHKIAKTGTYGDLIGIPTMTSDASVAGWGYTKNTGTLTGVKFNGATATVSEGIASITATIPAEVTESTVSGWGFTKNAGTLTGVKFNNADATVTNGIASITATIPSAPGTLNTNNTTAQTVNASEALSGTIKLHKVAKTGTYSDLIGTPAEVTSSTVSGWGFTKNNGTITGITMNGSSKGTSGVVDLGTVITSETSLSKGNTSGSGNAVTDIAVSGHQITLTKGSTFLTSHQSIKTINGNTMTGSGNVSINELPTVTSSDNGKVLMVVNGAWSLVTPVSIYSGSAAPNNSQGINGDIYLQV